MNIIKFEKFSEYKDFVKDDFKISDRRMFDSLVINITWMGKKKIIDLDTNSGQLRRCNIDKNVGEYLLDLLAKYEKEIVNLYGQEIFDMFQEGIGQKYLDSKGSVKKKSYPLDDAIVFSNFMGTEIYRAKSISVSDDSVTLNVTHVWSEKIKKMFLTKDSFKFDGDDAWFFSYYVKSTSKLQHDVHLSKVLFNILKKYAPNICPPFITPQIIENLGWEMTREQNFRTKNYSYNLYDNNIMRFNKNNKILLFYFNELKAQIFEITDDNNVLLEEFNVRTEKDLDRLKNI